MKIINAIFAQKVGGVEQVFRDYGEVLQKAGHEVYFLISDCKENNYKAKAIYRLKSLTPILDCLHILYILWRIKPDFIICHSLRLMKWMKYLRHFSKTKSIAVNHGMGYKKSLHCDYAINVNEEIANLLIKTGFDAKKSFVVDNGIRISEQYCPKKIAKTPTIGLYGRLDYDKGFDILIKAVAILQQKNIDFKLKLGGFENEEGYSWQDVKEMLFKYNLKKKCQIVGVVTDKKEFFSDVDIFCVPSRHESFGMVILEGFLYSTLVISSKTLGGSFLIKDGKNGLLFDINNPQDLADKICYVIDNQNDYQQITETAYDKLVSEFSLEKLQSKLEELLQKIK